MRKDKFIRNPEQLGAKLKNKTCIKCGKVLNRLDTITWMGVFIYHNDCYDKMIDESYLKKQTRISFEGKEI